ncbi:hypothetical protein Taro_003335 [Colocasia esculenta]|uniref:Uncharacterized protein n=1 Tax=Colocasia esculenta TaxID=4460 RepID=A0A843TRI6_COLES|nr:hypothetical protein [Colocasia esculenta]
MGGGTVLVQKGHGEADRHSAPSSLSVPPPGMAAAAQGGNPMATAKKWVTAKQARFQSWLAQQPIAVEAAVTTGLSALQGGFLGGLISTLGKDLQSETAKNPGMGPLGSSNQANPFLSLEGTGGSPLVQARNFAVLTGANAGISCVLKRIRGVDDVQNR